MRKFTKPILTGLSFIGIGALIGFVVLVLLDSAFVRDLRPIGPFVVGAGALFGLLCGIYRGFMIRLEQDTQLRQLAIRFAEKSLSLIRMIMEIIETLWYFAKIGYCESAVLVSLLVWYLRSNRDESEAFCRMLYDISDNDLGEFFWRNRTRWM